MPDLPVDPQQERSAAVAGDIRLTARLAERSGWFKHALDGPLLGWGTTSGTGGVNVSITIPEGTPLGESPVAICETTYVACTDTWSEFWVGGTTATFTVTPVVLAPGGTGRTARYDHNRRPDDEGALPAIPQPQGSGSSLSWLVLIVIGAGLVLLLLESRASSDD